jgi:hypothetical protein
MMPHERVGVGHGYSPSGGLEHGQVVKSVAECDGFVDVQAGASGDALERCCFVGVRVRYFHESAAGVGDDCVGSDDGLDVGGQFGWRQCWVYGKYLVYLAVGLLIGVGLVGVKYNLPVAQ